VGVDVNKTRRDHRAVGVNFAATRAGDSTHLNDSITIDCYVGSLRLAAVSVDHRAGANNYIVYRHHATSPSPSVNRLYP
jgi:hypothetical protein